MAEILVGIVKRELLFQRKNSRKFLLKVVASRFGLMALPEMRAKIGGFQDEFELG